MTNLTNVLQPPPPPMQLPLRARYSREQMRLYFFPYSERPIKELEGELRRWIALVVGLVLLVLFLFIWLVSSTRSIPNSSQITLNIGFWAIVCIVIFGVILILTKKIDPIKKRLNYERTELAKEQNDMQTNPPPTEEEFEAWINAVSDENSTKAPKKLQLPEQPGKYFGDLQVRAIVRPSQENQPSPWNSEAARIWAPRLHKWHYSVNIFTRLFVLEDYIAIYTDTFNVRDPRRTEEKSEHCFHQHVSYVSLDGQSETVEGTPGQLTIVLNQKLSIALDSGYKIKMDVASAVFSKRVRGQNGRYNSFEDTNDTNKVHKGLLEVLNDHKKSMLRSMSEHD